MTRPLALVLTALPAAVALIPALGARHDLRMLWMALAATLAARLVLAVTTGRVGRATAVSVALAAATVLATAVAFALGARAGPGAVAVALALAGCATAGAALGPWTRAPSLERR